MVPGTEYYISREQIMDPGTIRFNHIYPGEFKVVSTKKPGLVAIQYTHYGRFTGKTDAIPSAVFKRGVESALFIPKNA